MDPRHFDRIKESFGLTANMRANMGSISTVLPVCQPEETSTHDRCIEQAGEQSPRRAPPPTKSRASYCRVQNVASSHRIAYDYDNEVHWNPCGVRYATPCRSFVPRINRLPRRGNGSQAPSAGSIFIQRRRHAAGTAWLIRKENGRKAVVVVIEPPTKASRDSRRDRYSWTIDARLFRPSLQLQTWIPFSRLLFGRSRRTILRCMPSSRMRRFASGAFSGPTSSTSYSISNKTNALHSLYPAPAPL